ncbi:MAG: TRAP transporter large permease subunit, partial [Geminicoccaceae bacterium]|nr:TRAP transporter large permease subunit [Geminicoccaceae bacterium]
MVPVALLLLIVLLALSLPVAAALAFLSLGLDQLYSPMALSRAMGEIVWSASSNFLLVAVPLFVLLGEILLRSGIAERLYGATSQWLTWLPGGLMHANIGASMAFAATSGSSVATAATIGTVATPLIDEYRYGERLFLGSLAAGGTLGILIPRSNPMIVYAVSANVSVTGLFLAGLIPGILLVAL